MGIAGLTSLGIAVYILKLRPKTGMSAFSAALFLFSIWPLAQAADILTHDLALKVLLMKIRLDTPVFGVIAVIIMVAQITDMKYWVKRRVLFGLCVIPVLGAVLNWISPTRLFRYGFYLQNNALFTVLHWNNGPLFFIWLSNSYFLVMVPFYLFWRSRRESSHLASRQVITVFSALLLPVIVNALFQFGLSPITGFNLAPLAQLATSLIIGWAIMRRRAYAMASFPRGQIISLMKDGVVVLDEFGRITDINFAAQQILDIENQGVPIKFAKEIFSEWPLAARNLLNTEEGQTEISLKKDVWRYFDLRMAPLRDHRGQFTSRLLILRDITERKQSEEALRETEKKFSIMFQATPIGISLATISDGALFDVNQAWLDMLEYTCKEEIAGKNTLELGLITEPDQRELLNVFRKNGSVRNAEMTFHTQSGRLRTVLVNLETIDINGRTFMLSTNEDITERKQAEDILKRDKETFGRLVQEKTRELVETQLELERTKRLSDIGVLAATVAHELRNPLAVISMAAFHINKKNQEQNFDKLIALINKKVAESDQIINNLLFYSRIKPPRYESVDLFDIIRECAGTIKACLKKNVPIVWNIDSVKNIIIDADPIQLKEIVHNLLNNACDAVVTGTGGIEIAYMCEEGWVEMKVRDTGQGIDPENLAKVFDPFFTTKAKGTGLGLTVCKQIVSLHGGSINIQSKPGEGTTVTVRLPMKGRTHVR
jgi:PAS domain S-box-containing protein